MVLVALHPSGKRSPTVIYGTGAIVVLAAVLAYFLFFSSGSAPAPVAAPTRGEPASPDDTRLRNLRFNVEVLQDARFKALRVFGTIPVTAQKPSRRPNPFTR